MNGHLGRWIGLIVVGLIAVGILAFFLMREKPNEAPPETQGENQEVSVKPVIVDPLPIAENEDEEVDDSVLIEYTDERTGVVVQHPSSWTTEFNPGEVKWFFMGVQHIDDLEDITLEEFVGLGSGWGQTQDTFRREADLIANNDVVAPEELGFSILVKEFDNGLRAKAWLDGAEGAMLIRSYTLYHGDYRVIITTVMDGLLLEEGVTKEDIVEDQQLREDAPQSIKDHVAEFDAIVETLNFSAL